MTTVALAHEYFASWGGAEQVVRVLHAEWPDAPVYTLFAERRHRDGTLAGWDLRASWLQRLPLGDGRHRLLLPLLPRAVESMRVAPADVLVSSSSAFIKGLRVPPGTRHVCYCHSPTRYLWDWSEQYVREEVPTALRPIVKALLVDLRAWDLEAARGVDRFVANSRVVRDRIRRYYGRDSEVVHPPVDVAAYPLRESQEDFYLAISRLVPYKNLDVAVRAFNTLGMRLKIVGEGRERGRLERLAGDNVEFLGRQPAATVRELLAVARGLVFPAEDDFGLVCAEALAAGRPVVALARGGATEIVEDGRTGALFDVPTPEALVEAVRRAEAQHFDRAELRRAAERFDAARFRARMRAIVTEEAVPSA